MQHYLNTSASSSCGSGFAATCCLRPSRLATLLAYLPCCRRLSMERICGRGGRGWLFALEATGRFRRKHLVGRHTENGKCSSLVGRWTRLGGLGRTDNRAASSLFQSVQPLSPRWVTRRPRFRRLLSHDQPVKLTARSSKESMPHRVGRHVGRVLVDHGAAKAAGKHLDGLQASAGAHLRVRKQGGRGGGGDD